MFSLSLWFFSSLDRSHSQFPGKTTSLFPQGITLCNFALFLIEDWISKAKQVDKANVNVDWVVALLKISIQMGEVVIAVIYSMCVAESNKMLPAGLWSLQWEWIRGPMLLATFQARFTFFEKLVVVAPLTSVFCFQLILIGCWKFKWMLLRLNEWNII